MLNIKFVLLSFLGLSTFTSAQEIIIGKEKPNIVLIYVDDLGYGDIGINGAIGVETPNTDKLAANGINFTDAHSAAATCTPSRYSLLTGQYAFRSKAQIIDGDASLIINPEVRTLPDMLKHAGYSTGVVGKWHLGLGNGNTNWNGRVHPGPKEVGFDYSFLIPSTGDRVPTVYLENQKVVGLSANDPIHVSYTERLDGYPIGTEHPELLKQHTDSQHLGSIINGISRIGYMKGGESALWVDEEIPFVLTNRANSFINTHAEKPFFLFFSLHDIHQPRIANIKFVEASSMGPRGDVIAQMDWCVGQVMGQLEKLGLTKDTMIIFTSDNGPILDDGYLDYAPELVGDHSPGGGFKGSKYSIYEAGTRMPTIVSWPKAINPGTSHALLSQVDLYASLAKLVGQKLEKKDAPDSEEHLNAWLGKTSEGRKVLLEEAYTFGLRMGDYKYIMPKKSNEVPEWLVNKFVDPGFSTLPLLFNLKNDRSEEHNIAAQHPKIVEQMQQQLNKILGTNESH
ncbi:arylsulfatase [Aggregatimonas sangjinii]|uniref:Arylsulfatase n=1 Tax=Aggregatimonas sangjinii TaxID=2583587 RepID=A0A5B7SR80_9FLAO|nr:sulfatase-like hydrolase/transferase [Aggregatimonas sangjinii]QCW99522.1 arylsulfatase [Aggregatimonas sangjinii]